MYRHRKKQPEDRRLRVLSVFFLALALWIIARLFILQVWQHDYYRWFAASAHEIYTQLYPHRGSVFMQDTRSGQRYPVAINKQFYLIYAVPQELAEAGADIASTTARLGAVLSLADPAELQLLQQKLSKAADPYEVVARKVSEEVMQTVTALGIRGIYALAQEHRFYPEEQLGAPLLGFTGFDEQGRLTGRYGLEEYWEKELAGTGGFLGGERGALGSWINVDSRHREAPQNGSDLVLTIDRSLQHEACSRLQRGFQEYSAKSASLVLLNATTGAVLAMCSLPDFDPNKYAEVTNAAAFNNHAIFTAYEPGSVFKPLTMAAALDLGLVSPATTFTDPCFRKIDGFTIRNADDKCYKTITMTQVLENSVNTGMIWVQEQVGRDRFREYMEKFGFGQKTGIALDTEVAGDISSLRERGKIYGAVGAFGQGLTVTPLQLATAYSALVNGGQLVRPYIIDEIRHADGRVEKISPNPVGQAISAATSQLIRSMLVAVVEKGYSYRNAKISGYYVGGKTGTAQIAERGVYSGSRTNHTFAGFATGDQPQFVLVVRYEEPERRWAESTAEPVFRDVMQFVLRYYMRPKER